jgi:hypothetical protein
LEQIAASHNPLDLQPGGVDPFPATRRFPDRE